MRKFIWLDKREKISVWQKPLDYEEWYAKYVEGREQPKLESKGEVVIEPLKPPASPAPVIAKPVEIDAEVLTTGGDGGIINSGKVYKFEEYLSNPSLLAESTPKQKFDFFVNNGNRVIPYLGRGNFKKIPYDQGGGFRVFFDENEEYLLQYHPEERSHHKGAYYKLSDGGKPKRYKLDGTEIVD